MTQAIEKLTEKRRKWVEANRENGFEAGIKRLLTDLYPDTAHFIYELLQNAEDAYAQKVRIFLHEDRIEFEHDGKKLFSIQDVNAITSIGLSTKRDDVTNIGKFGVGFKAIFAYTDTPEIESGEFHFRIRDMVVPELVSRDERLETNGQTRFILPFNNPKKPSNHAMKEIERLLKALDASTLIFLTYIRKIEYFLPDLSLGYIERIEHSDYRFEIRIQHPEEPFPLSTWFLKFDKEVQVEDEEAENAESKIKTCRIAVAFGISPLDAKADTKKNGGDGAKAKAEWEIVQMEPGAVCIYFPADKETSNLRFHLHAPFASTVARGSVRDCAGNDALRDHLAELLAESMHDIRDQGLLTVRALALLPNDKDNLPEFYKPLMDRLVAEFKKEMLVPMKRGGHGAASSALRGARVLSDLIDDEDLDTLLGGEYSAPIWAANPPQRNQREDTFLSMLEIGQWDIAQLVKTLGKMNEDSQAEWLGSKDEEWHQVLYEILMDYLLNSTERRESIMRLAIVRCIDGVYRKGCDCFFPTEGIQNADRFPRIAKGVYISGKGENKKARDFLDAVGVREVDEKVEIEAILKTNYNNQFDSNCIDHYSHLKMFMRFLKENPDQHNLFQNAKLFMVDGEKDVKWATPEAVYLDEPYVDTGLRAYYEAFEAQAERQPLSIAYEKYGIEPKEVGGFAENLGASTKLRIEKIEVTHNHPEWSDLSQRGGERWTGSGKNEDYNIPRLADFLAVPSISKSRLVWRTMRDSCCQSYSQYLRARFGRNASNIASAKSTLVHNLMTAKWIPQRHENIIEFVQPRDAVAEKLPEGIEYQTGWQWLQELEFGKGVEERRESQRRAQERQTSAYKRKEEIAKDLGFESPEEAEEIARLKKKNPQEFRKWKEKISACKECPIFPTKPVSNPERHQERLGEHLLEAPDKEYEKQERSVRTTNGAIDPITWLRNKYTNEADQMVCQICKEEMPFRKRDGAYYFEKKEVLSRKYLPKEHEAQYLALCPLCAAKYEEFVKKDDDVMAKLKESFISAEGCEIPISLGDQKTSIRFVETHYHDLKTIIEGVE